MTKHQPRRHVLLQARTVAAVGLISVGGGIGLALMLARTLISVGFAVALASELAVFWIYWEALRSLYRAATKRIPYRGPPAKELAVANIFAVLMIGISIAVFSIAIAEQPSAGRATLEFGGLDFVKIPQSSPTGFLNIQIKNVGTLSAESVSLLVTGHVRSELITPDAIREEVRALEDALPPLDRATLVPGRARSQVRPGNASVITLEDVAPSTYPDLIAKKAAPPQLPIQLTDDQWREFENGKSYIYILFAANYEDDAHPGAYWTVSTCLYYVGTRAFWHNCGPNRIDLVKSSRTR